ncbi:hypothetical protein F511_12322 [Dorcoceras hygrometricum]|uniref:Uncharacterized protein n=1 Tax=Dorcoceras hygrometricum TaxID=472368 RepID=A0A2Z7BHA8_9LAMI|nr:hypothetical protein F511_12322 [Dorcoceras hygrometricum]
MSEFSLDQVDQFRKSRFSSEEDDQFREPRFSSEQAVQLRESLFSSGNQLREDSDRSFVHRTAYSLDNTENNLEFRQRRKQLIPETTERPAQCSKTVFDLEHIRIHIRA